MQSPFKLASSIVAILAMVACATPLEVEKIPLSADPDQQIAELALDLSAARSREVDTLSPSWFARAADARKEARELRGEGAELSEIFEAVAEGNAALDQAEAYAGLARTALEKAFDARTRALEAGAASLGDPFEVAESKFRNLAAEIESNELEEPISARDELAEQYRALELRAIKERTLGDARNILERAADAGAPERVPGAYATARSQLEEAEKFIEKQRYADVAMREHAEVARFFARRAYELNRAATAVAAKSPEEIALEQERQLRQLAEFLGLPDRRDWPLSDRWTSIGIAAEAVRSDRDFVVGQNQELRSDLRSSRAEIDKLRGSNRLLAQNREFNRLFETARNNFSEEEAEVYRQGHQLIIRLRALDFPVGEATIEADDYALLSKVQRAIRTFGQPRVTIEGHTDSTGGTALNESLSQKRAEAVRDYLVANNVVPAHLVAAIGRASEEPLGPNETADGRALNRRIDIILDTREILLIAAF